LNCNDFAIFPSSTADTIHLLEIFPYTLIIVCHSIVAPHLLVVMHVDSFSLQQDHKETNSIPLELLCLVFLVYSLFIKQNQVIGLFSIWLTF
jgi:hypothetical protein